MCVNLFCGLDKVVTFNIKLTMFENMDNYPFTDNFFELLGQYPGQIPAPTIPVKTAENYVPLVHTDAEFQRCVRLFFWKKETLLNLIRIFKGFLETAINEEIGKFGGLLQYLLRDFVVVKIN